MLISINKLSEVTGRDRRTITKLLANLKPRELSRNTQLYDSTAALACIYGGPEPVNTLDLTRERARESKANADLKELDYQQRLGELVSAREMEIELSAVFVGIRSEIESGFAKFVAGIESQHNIEVSVDYVDKSLTAILDAIAAYPAGTAGADDAAAELDEEAEEDPDD